MSGKFTSVFLLIGAVVPAYGWWDNGHSLVGQVAFKTLQDGGKQEVIDKIQTILHYQAGASDYPGWDNIPMAATWPDHIKCSANTTSCGGMNFYNRLNIFDDLHYSDVPFHYDAVDPDTGIVTDQQVLDFVGSTANIGAGTTLAHIMNGIIDTTSTRRRALRRLFTDDTGSAYGYDIQIRLLLHIMGDIHQPLHSAAAYGWNLSDLAQTDNGGNSIKLTYATDDLTTQFASMTNLHSLWDSGCGNYTLSFPDQKLIDNLSQMAIDVVANYTKDAFTDAGQSESNYLAAFQESYTISATQIYPDTLSGIDVSFDPSEATPNYPPIDQLYLDNCWAIVQKRIAAAGYRLAYYLEQVADDIPQRVLDSAKNYQRTNSATPVISAAVASVIGTAFLVSNM